MNLFRYLWRLFRAFPARVASFFVATTVQSSATILLGGYIARGFVNHLSGVQDGALGLEASLVLLGIMILLALAGQAANMFTSVTTVRHSMAMICLNIMEHLFKRPGGLPMPVDRKKGRPTSEGQALNTLSNDTIKVPGMFEFIFEVAAMLVSAVVAFWIMASIDAFVTLVVFCPLAVLFIVLNRLQKRVEPLARKARRAAGEVSSMLSDMFNCVQTAKTSGAEGHFVREFRRRNEERLAASLRSELFFTILRGLNSGLMEIGAGVILLAAAGSMARGSFTVGDFILFTSYLWAVLGIFRWGGSLLAEVKRNNVSIDRMESLMHPEPPLSPVRDRKLNLDHVPELRLELDRRGEDALALLEVRELSFRYSWRKDEGHHDDEDEAQEGGAGESGEEPAGEGPAGGLPAEGQAGAGADFQPFGLESISFGLEAGSLTVVTGPVGSGKSTLLKCLIGLLPPDSGEILWNGRPVALGTELERSAFWRAPRSAYTPQVPRLFSETLKENILLGMPESEADLEALAEQACLEKDLRDMPQGLSTQIGPRGVRLSGGQVQRAAAARMFARGAALNVLDDISSALDVETERRLWDRLTKEGDGRTFLVVSHREALLRRADRILLMDGGRLVAQGGFEELAAGSALFRALLRREDPGALDGRGAESSPDPAAEPSLA